MEMYFSGKLEKDKIITVFTSVKLAQPNFEIVDVLDAFSQKIFIDSIFCVLINYQFSI